MICGTIINTPLSMPRRRLFGGRLDLQAADSNRPLFQPHIFLSPLVNRDIADSVCGTRRSNPSGRSDTT